MRLIVGISGKAQVGKDTIGDYLVRKYGFEKLGFAIYLKSLATKVFGWNGQKDGKGRQLLQDLGQTIRHYDEEFWLRPVVNYVMSNMDRHMVVTDVRHINEASTIQNLGGYLIRIERKDRDLGQLGGHESEIALDFYTKFDLVIQNNGGFDELFKKVSDFIDPKLITDK